MKFAYPRLHQVIEIREGEIAGLVVENQRFMYALVADINRQIQKEDGEALLSIDNTPVEISQYVELLADYWSFELNQKSLLSKIVSAMGNLAQNERFYEQTNRLLAMAEGYINELAYEFDMEISCNPITTQAFIKAIGVHIEVTSDSLCEQLLAYMKLIREFDRDKLFIFVNLRSFLSLDELQAFSDTVTMHGYRVLYIDNREYPILAQEQRLVVDKDLCEI